jgi:hypothetical protein
MNITFRVLALCLGLVSIQASAALVDEIQVYTDKINEPGAFGVELHTIYFSNGRKTPDYPREVTTHHSLFVTPEFSYGLTKTLEAGFYLPTARDGATGNYYMAGYKARLKWLPIQGEKDTGGLFAGANLEIGRVAERFDQTQSNAELRFMLGWRDEEWLLAFNPKIGKGLSNGASSERADWGLQLKGAHRVAAGVSMGLEYYTGQGEIGRSLTWAEQDNKIFLVLDYDREPLIFSIGIGHGLTQAAEKTTIKMIVELPF